MRAPNDDFANGVDPVDFSPGLAASWRAGSRARTRPSVAQTDFTADIAKIPLSSLLTRPCGRHTDGVPWPEAPELAAHPVLRTWSKVLRLTRFEQLSSGKIGHANHRSNDCKESS